jgi:hypothetical protein
MKEGAVKSSKISEVGASPLLFVGMVEEEGKEDEAALGSAVGSASSRSLADSMQRACDDSTICAAESSRAATTPVDADSAARTWG